MLIYLPPPTKKLGKYFNKILLEKKLIFNKYNKSFYKIIRRKVKLIVDDVESMNARTTFYGMDITRDKLFSMVRKW